MGDAKYDKLRDDIPPTVCLSYLQLLNINKSMIFEVRGEGSLTFLTGAIRHEALASDKDITLVKVETQAEIIDQTLVLERTFATLSTAFALPALLIACLDRKGRLFRLSPDKK